MHKSIWDSFATFDFWGFSVFCSVFVLAKSLLTSQIEFAAQVLLAPLATSPRRCWRRSHTGSLLIFGHVVSFNFTLSKDKDRDKDKDNMGSLLIFGHVVSVNFTLSKDKDKDKDRYKDNMGSLVIFGRVVHFNTSLIKRTFLVYTLIGSAIFFFSLFCLMSF